MVKDDTDARVAECNDELKRLAGDFSDLWQKQIADMTNPSRGSDSLEQAGLAWQQFWLRQMSPMFAGASGVGGDLGLGDAGDESGTSTKSASEASALGELRHAIAKLTARLEELEQRIRGLEQRSSQS